MKKMFLLGMLLTVSMSFAQLKKVHVTPAETIGKAQQFGGPLEAEITKSGNKYTLRFRDQQFKTLDEYREFTFEDVDNTFNDLYAAIEEGFTTMPKESVMLELPDYLIGLHFSKFLGSPVLRFSCASMKVKDAPVYFSNEIAKKQVEKLFAKKK
ncbi:hypothetical protein ACX0HA_11900 [Flavobacterium hauense]